MGGNKGVLKELSEWFRFYRSLSKRDRRIVFYSEDAASYSYFEGLIERLAVNEGVSVCYITSDPDDPVFSQPKPNLHPFYLKRLLPSFILFLDTKFLIMTMPDLGRFHVKRSAHNVNHVYMLHNIGSSFPVIRHGALFCYDTIFLSGPHHKEEIRRQEELYKLDRKELVPFGYYRVEKIAREYRRWLERGNRPEPDKVLLGPSWGDESILNRVGMDLCAAVLDAGYKLVLRPHPMTLLKTPEVVEEIVKTFRGNKNFIYQNDISLFEDMFSATTLISDWSGFSYEFCFGTERPALFIDVPRKIVNEKWEALGIEPIDVDIRREMGIVIGENGIGDIPAAMERLRENEEEFRKNILAARERCVYSFGESSEAGAGYIMDNLEKEKTP